MVSDGEDPVLENVEYSFVAITPRFTQTWIDSTCLSPFMGQIKPFNHLLKIIISYLKP